MQAALLTYLLEAVSLTGQVGRRINWRRRPQGEGLPALTLNLIGGVPDYLLTGAYGLTESRVQAECWGSTYAQALAVSEALKALLSGQRFVQGDTRFEGVFIASERDDSFDDAPDVYFRFSLDLMILHASAL